MARLLQVLPFLLLAASLSTAASSWRSFYENDGLDDIYDIDYDVDYDVSDCLDSSGRSWQRFCSSDFLELYDEEEAGASVEGSEDGDDAPEASGSSEGDGDAEAVASSEPPADQGGDGEVGDGGSGASPDEGVSDGGLGPDAEGGGGEVGGDDTSGAPPDDQGGEAASGEEEAAPTPKKMPPPPKKPPVKLPVTKNTGPPPKAEPRAEAFISPVQQKGAGDDLMDCSPVRHVKGLNPQTWGEWKRVMVTAQLTKGLIFGETLKKSGPDMFQFVKKYKDTCIPVEDPAQLLDQSDSEVFIAHSATASSYMKSGFLDVKVAASCPYVSVSSTISKSEKSVKSDQRRTTYVHATRLLSKAKFTLTQLFEKGFLELAPGFVKKVQEVARPVSAKAQTEAVKELRDQYGFIWANQATLGASYATTTVSTFENQQEEDNAKNSISVSVEGGLGGYSAGVDVQSGSQTQSKKSSSQDSSKASTSIRGGKLSYATDNKMGKWAESVDQFEYWTAINYLEVLPITELPGLEKYKTALSAALKKRAREGDAAAQTDTLLPESELQGPDDILVSKSGVYRLIWRRKSAAKGDLQLAIVSTSDPDVVLWPGPDPNLSISKLALTVDSRLQYVDKDGKVWKTEDFVENNLVLKLFNDGSLALVEQGDTKFKKLFGHPEILPSGQGRLKPDNFLFGLEPNTHARVAFGLSTKLRALVVLYFKDGMRPILDDVISPENQKWAVGLDGPDANLYVTPQCELIVGTGDVKSALFRSSWYSSKPALPGCHLYVYGNSGYGASVGNSRDYTWSTGMPNQGLTILSAGPGADGKGLALGVNLQTGAVEMDRYRNSPNQHWKFVERRSDAAVLVHLPTNKQLRTNGDWAKENGHATLGNTFGDNSRGDETFDFWLHRGDQPFCYIEIRCCSDRRLKRLGDNLGASVGNCWKERDNDSIRWFFIPVGSPNYFVANCHGCNFQKLTSSDCFG